MFRDHPVLSMVVGSLYRLPVSVNISYFWNFGSLVGLFLGVQIVSGFMLATRYSAYITQAFASVNHIMRDVEGGWVLRFVHSNGASFFLGCMYIHVGRGLFYKRYFSVHVWNIGVVLLLLSMLTGFLGYVLPWGQMSFWGATVITNLLSVLPWGSKIVAWLWGGYAVDKATLSRFYALHFIMPFVIMALSLLHLFFLHDVGSGNPQGFSTLKVDFWPYFGIKDLLGYMVVLVLFFSLVFFFPFSLGDSENFHKATSFITPVHIKPEWYYLFAYAILRSIPNKAVGVLALVFSICVFFFFPWFRFRSGNRLLWWWCFNFILLTWLGGCPVKVIYTMVAQIAGVLYFFLLFLCCC
uniref:Cytochrome b n=1 Tax=Rhodosoma turcicum TaxID=1256665 RepID=S0DF37_9ASCI|nr:cytochrome b [Rhodosoma turcicum]CCO25795.1 cytochrome b [Rhodosoma turcicum]